MEATKSQALGWMFTKRWLFVAPAMLFLWIVAQIDKTNVSLIIADSHFLNELHLVGHNAQLGGLMSAFFLGYGCSIFGWGILVDRFGPRVCTLAGSFLWAALLFSSSRVTTINEYLLVRFLLGVAEGNLWPVCNALTNYWYPVREHARVQTFWVSGSTLGTAIGVPIVSALMLANGWRLALAYVSLVSLLPLAVFFFVGDRPRAHQQVQANEREDAARADGFTETNLPGLWRSSSFWLVTFCQFVSCTTIYTLIQWLPSYLTNVRHVPFKSMGALITVGYMIGTVMTLSAGYIADRTMRRSLTAGIVCFLFVLVVIPAQTFTPWVTAVLLSTLIGVPGTTGALNGALMHRMIRSDAIARATGVYTGTGNLVSAFGPTLFGVLISAMAGQYWGGWLFLALVNASGAVAYFILHRQETRVVTSTVAVSIAGVAATET
jgi:MFS transporter, ACS family, D-galactonate transporter